MSNDDASSGAAGPAGAGATRDPANRVLIFDTTLRDGEQSPGISLNKQEKLEIAHQLARLNVDVIEAGFPITSPGDFESVQAIAREVEGPVICGLARTSKQDIEAAWNAVRDSERPRIHTFIATSDIHIERKLQTTREDVKGQVRAAVAQAREYTEDVEFSPEDGSRSDVEYMAEVIQIALDEGATTINVPDTVGYTMPREYNAMFTELYRLVPDLRKVVVSVHCHDDLGLAAANSLAAITSGARQVECTINGIGERAGNAALEEIASALYVRSDRYGVDTSIKLDQLYPTSQVLGQIITFRPSPNKAIVGANAFAHESGIHQHGMLANPLCYEIMTPALVGVARTHLVLGKHSGRAALRHRLEQLGYTLSREELQQTYYRFVAMADRKKNIYDQDLVGILPDQIRERHSEPVSELD